MRVLLSLNPLGLEVTIFVKSRIFKFLRKSSLAP